MKRWSACAKKARLMSLKDVEFKKYLDDCMSIAIDPSTVHAEAKVSELPTSDIKAGDIQCGGALVEFMFGREKEDVVVSAVKVSRGDLSTVLWYEGVGVVGGMCVPNRLNKPTIVYQAYCNGSGCYDQDNWGIIDPQSLQVLLVPNDWNRKDASKIIGRELPDIKMIYLHSK